jgi:hypothetical protein
LKELDTSNIFDRVDGTTPFLLLDGHHSRFGLPFLEYIHSEQHKWTCCIGVPYGTHLWQVADSSQINGGFKIALTRFKREVLACLTGNTPRFMQTDIISLVRKAWYASFAKQESAKVAIAKRGWNPLIFYLLDHPNLSLSFNNGVSDNSNQSGDSTLAIINQTVLKFNNGLNQFILIEAKKEGRKRKLEEQQKKVAAREENFTSLVNYTRLTASSGSLAKHNIFEIGAGLLAKVREKDEAEERKKQRISFNTVEREKQNGVRFQHAFSKYKNGKSLTREDLIALINRTKIASDPANGKNTKELTMQWEERKHRLNVFFPPEEVKVDVMEQSILEDFVDVVLQVEPLQHEEVRVMQL